MNEGKLLEEAADKINKSTTSNKKDTYTMITSYSVGENKDNVVKTTTKPRKKSDLEKWVDFINKNHLAFQSEGKSYLKVEAWNYMFTLKGLAPTIMDVKSATVPIVDSEGKKVLDDDGVEQTTMGFFVQASLVPLSKHVPDSNGVPIASSAYGACVVGENDYCNDYYSALSMAQTRAIGKLGRSVFGHLAVACGFQACPFEEIKK